MRSTALSVVALGDEARCLLATLAQLPPKPGSFARSTALALAGADSALAELAAAGLVEGVGPDRLTLHQTIVDFARSQLRRPGLT